MEPIEAEKRLEVWLRMYEEQMRHVRHHESLRATSTNIVIAISGAAFALLGAKDALGTTASWLLALFVVLINGYGFLMSHKHYERSRRHHTVGSGYRRIISETSLLRGEALNAVRSEGQNKNKQRFQWMSQIRTFKLWSGLHVLLMILGTLLIVWTLSH